MDNQDEQNIDNQSSPGQDAEKLIALDEIKNQKDEGITSPGVEDNPYQLVPRSGPHDYVSPPHSGLLKKAALFILIGLLIGLAIWTEVSRQHQLNKVINSKPQSIPPPQ